MTAAGPTASATGRSSPESPLALPLIYNGHHIFVTEDEGLVHLRVLTDQPPVQDRPVQDQNFFWSAEDAVQVANELLRVAGEVRA